MAGDQSLNRTSGNSLHNPMPTSPGLFEDTNINFDQKTLAELTAIVSMEDNNNFPVIKVENEEELFNNGGVNLLNCYVKPEPGMALYSGSTCEFSPSHVQSPMQGNGYNDHFTFPQSNELLQKRKVASLATSNTTASIGGSVTMHQDLQCFAGHDDQEEEDDDDDDIEEEKQTLNWNIPVGAKRKSGAGRKPKMPYTGDVKKERRKAQNRKAAKNYREKQKTRKERVESDYTELISERAEIQNEVSQLKDELANLQKILLEHQKSGKCRLQKPSNLEIASNSVQIYTATPTSSSALQSETVGNHLVHQNTGVNFTSRIPHPTSVHDFSSALSPCSYAESVASPYSPACRNSIESNNAAVPPYTPNSDQSFAFDSNIYSPTPATDINGTTGSDKQNGKVMSSNVCQNLAMLSSGFPEMPAGQFEGLGNFQPCDNSYLMGNNGDLWSTAFDSLSYAS